MVKALSLILLLALSACSGVPQGSSSIPVCQQPEQPRLPGPPLHERPVAELGRRMQQWLLLAIAIVSEVIATSALKASEGFSRLWPSLVVVAGYAAAFYCLSLTLKTIPIGVVYAIWSGVGIALIALIGWLVFGQSLDAAAIIGMLLIIAGVVVLNVFSKTVAR